MSAHKKETAIEVKVGALVVFSLLLLGAFVFILGDFGFDDTTTYYVEYQDIGGLKPGAAVKQGGIQIGEVSEIEYLGGQRSEETGEPIWARVVVEVDDDHLEGIRETSEFYITAEGVLGEKFVGVRTRDPEAPAVEPNHVFRGRDPMGIEQVMAKVSESLDAFNSLLNDNSDLPIGELLTNINNLVVHTDEMIVANRDRISSILGNADRFMVSARETIDENRRPLAALLTNTNEFVGDARLAVRDARSTMARIDSVVSQLDVNFGPVIDRIVTVSEKVEKFTTTALRIAEDAEPRIQTILTDADAAMKDVRHSTAEVAALVDWVSEGNGTVGGLLRDEEIFDNMRELLRELKRRPWKIVWKE